MNEIVYFFRKMTPGAFSIDQIFETLSAEVGKTLNVRRHELHNAGARLRSIAANIAEAKKVAGSGICHITGDVHYIALGLQKRSVVLTIHDCVILDRTPRWHPKFHLYLWLWYKLPIWIADAVTTISQKSKDEIVAFTDCDPQKITVVPNFVNEAYRFYPKTFDKKRPRILQVGLFPNKNFERVAIALAGIPCILEIIGEPEESHRQLLDRCRIDFESRANLPLEEMAERYRRADMLVFASTYEGFGLPIVEAQATGRPVVAGNLEPMTWVAGEQGACFVDPLDTNAIREGILKVIEDDVFREKLVQNGLKNVQRFTLQQVAQQYMAVYESLLNSTCAA